mgnify:CR=1 FL=1
MIKKFSCDNFRNIRCSDLEFEKVNILIGPNNAGKSNFIRALSFAANMVSNPKIDTTGFLSELKRNGWNDVGRRDIECHSFRLNWTLELTKDMPVTYSLKAHIGKKREENYIAEEVLNSAIVKKGNDEPYNFFTCHGNTPGEGNFSTAGMDKVQNNRLKAKVAQDESVLLQMDNLFFQNKNMFSTPFVRDSIRNVLDTMRTYFNGFYAYSCTSFDIFAIREMQDELADGSMLLKTGLNFVNVFAYMNQVDSQFKERYLKMLQRLLPECEDIYTKTAAGKIWAEMKMRGQVFQLSELSDGTIHLLVLILMLNLPREASISMLAIDEPEMNLHPAWQKMLAKEILRCSGVTQCFISTHSPDFLDEFTEGFLSGGVAIFVFDPSRRETIRKLSRNELKNDLEEWTLGDLYRVADPMIGGWPQ